MRISDWSSDVCSSDLAQSQQERKVARADAAPPGDHCRRKLRVGQMHFDEAEHFLQVPIGYRLAHRLQFLARSHGVANQAERGEIGSAACRARGWQYG